jgi:His-Xaa-Ser system protein HxsD
MEITLVNSETISVLVDQSIYNMDTLHKCFYWYGADFSIDFKNVETNVCQITLISKDNSPLDVESISKKIKTDLIDFKLRDIVTKETVNIRELLIAQAFANYELQEDPTREISDPVGFEPKDVNT